VSAYREVGMSAVSRHAEPFRVVPFVVRNGVSLRGASCYTRSG
jgi:hypothetical protein